MSWHYPRWCSLEYYQLRALGSYLGYDLCCCGSCANYSYSFTLQAVVPVPTCRMHHFSVECVDVRKIGVMRLIELANCRNQEVRAYGVKVPNFRLLSTYAFYFGLPFVVLIVPASLIHCRTKANMPVKLILVCDAYQVTLNFLLPRIFARPLAIWLEGVRVEVAKDCGTSGKPFEPLSASSPGNYEDIPSQQQPGYMLSFHVPPTWLLFSTITKFRPWPLLIISMAVHRPTASTISIHHRRIQPPRCCIASNL